MLSARIKARREIHRYSGCDYVIVDQLRAQSRANTITLVMGKGALKRPTVGVILFLNHLEKNPVV